MAIINCDDNASRECLDELVKIINDDLTVACQIPFTVPKKELARIINRAKDYFYKIYEDSVEETYLALPRAVFATDAFKNGNFGKDTVLNDSDITSPRGVVPMPEQVYSINNVFEINRFSGEDGGFGSRTFSAGDRDFAIDKFVYSDAYRGRGAGIASDNLMYYVINEKFIDNARQVLQQQISYSYNRLTNKFRFLGELPQNDVIFQAYIKVPDCALFADEAFQRYVIARAKQQLSRILGTFQFNLPGNITINYDLIQSEATDEIDKLIEEIKLDDGADWFFTA